MDEATANLDPASIQIIEAGLLTAVNRGLKIIIVTHDIGQARRLACDVCFLTRTISRTHPSRFFFQSPAFCCSYCLSAGELTTTGWKLGKNEKNDNKTNMRRICFRTFDVCIHGAEYRTADNKIIVQSTTSTKNSGLYDYILPLIKQDTGVTVHVVAVGTGAAIKNAMNCDGDVLLVHSRKREDKFVAEGYAKQRHDVMYNDYVLVGPQYDPAGISSLQNAAAALKKLQNQNLYLSHAGICLAHIARNASYGSMHLLRLRRIQANGTDRQGLAWAQR